MADSLPAQIREIPALAKGGTANSPSWSEPPAMFKESLQIPQYPVPTDLAKWKQARLQVRERLVDLLGDLPARPDPKLVKVVSREDRGTFFLERFEFHNGADMIVPGYLLIPKEVTEANPRPAILALHEHGGSKDSVCLQVQAMDHVGTELVQAGYIVAAIDSYFHGDRVGKGPGGSKENKAAQEMTLSKLNLWLGRSLWGMQVRDDQCLLDYVSTRPEVDRTKIGATGMSMGCTRAWWLAAMDERVTAVVGVACFTRYSNLIANAGMKYHGIYYYVPGMLKHFDTEAVHALIAPRPHLELSGDQDPGAPNDGIAFLEQYLGETYKLYGQSENFVSVQYAKTGHEYLPEMHARMVAWFQKHLPIER